MQIKIRSPKFWILLTLALLLIAAITAGILWLCNYDTMDHADWISGDGASAYNSAATARARATGQILKNEVLILSSVQKDLGGDTVVKFTLYRLPDGADEASILRCTADSVPASLSLMGYASAKFLGDRTTSIYNLLVEYIY